MRYTLLFSCFLLLVSRTNVAGQFIAQDEDVKTVDTKLLKTMDLFILANQKKLIGRYEDAIGLYKQVIQLDELNAAAHHDLARIYTEQEDLETALSMAKKAVRFAPDNHWYKMTLIHIHELQMDHKAAADLLAKVIQSNPDEDLYHRWADNLIAANDYVAAIETYDAADRTLGASEWRSDSKVDLYLKLDKEKEALAEVKQWMTDYPDDVKYIIKLARYYEFRGDIKASKKTYAKALELDPTHEEAQYKVSTLGKSSVGSSDTELAALINNETIGIDHKIAAIMPLLNAGNQWEVVTPAAVQLVDLYPEDPKSHALLGDTYWLQGNIKEASAAYEQSLAKSKSVYQVWDHYLQSLAILGDNATLEKWANDAVTYYPNQAGPYFYVALVNFRNEKLEKVDLDLEEALFIADGTDDYILERAHMLKAQMAQKQTNADAALAYLDKVPDKAVGPSLLEYWADLLIEKGDTTAAKTKLENALQRGGDAQRIKAKISTL